MSSEILPSALPNKFFRLSRVIIAATKPHDAGFLEVVNEDYVSSREYSNPDVTTLTSVILEQVRAADNSHVDLFTVPWSQQLLSKGNLLTAATAFADMHEVPLDPIFFPPEETNAYINLVIAKADNLNRQITLNEQLEIALSLSRQHVLGALIIAHAGSRLAARHKDTRLYNFKEDSELLMKKWRDCVSGFKDTFSKVEDTGATYHLWAACAGGITSEVVVHARDTVLNPIYKIIYPNIALVTKVGRTLGGQTDKRVHPEADKLGFLLGQQMAHTITSNS